MATSGSRLLSSNRAGWSMAAPAVGLILLFVIVPFALAFGLSFTNQRLFSPNPTEWVGTQNFGNLLGVGILTLEPERDEAGAVAGSGHKASAHQAAVTTSTPSNATRDQVRRASVTRSARPARGASSSRSSRSRTLPETRRPG